MVRFYFALFLVVSSVAQTTSANYLHLMLKAKDFNFDNFAQNIEELEDPEEILSQLDEDKLTVLGRAIVEGRRAAIEYLLAVDFDHVGPKGEGKTLAQFSMQARDPEIYMLLFEYEKARLKYSSATSVGVARDELRKFRERVQPPTSSPNCKSLDPFRWPPLYGAEPEMLRTLNRVIGETCRSISRSADDL